MPVVVSDIDKSALSAGSIGINHYNDPRVRGHPTRIQIPPRGEAPARLPLATAVTSAGPYHGQRRAVAKPTSALRLRSRGSRTEGPPLPPLRGPRVNGFIIKLLSLSFEKSRTRRRLRVSLHLASLYRAAIVPHGVQLVRAASAATRRRCAEPERTDRGIPRLRPSTASASAHACRVEPAEALCFSILPFFLVFKLIRFCGEDGKRRDRDSGFDALNGFLLSIPSRLRFAFIQSALFPFTHLFIPFHFHLSLYPFHSVFIYSSIYPSTPFYFHSSIHLSIPCHFHSSIYMQSVTFPKRYE